MSKIYEALQRAGANVPADFPAAPSSEALGYLPGSAPQNGNGSGHPDPVAAPAPRLTESSRVIEVNPNQSVHVFPFGRGQAGPGEQYRIIRNRIVQSVAAPKLILVTSADSGDGKTTNAINIAGALALRPDLKVLIVDADLCRPAVARLLGIASAPGLADVLRGTCALHEAIARIGRFPNLYVLTAGDTVTNRTELFDSARWRETCDSVRAEFQYTLVDAPPIETVADYPLIQHFCDSVLVIVRPDHTNRARLLHALKTIPKEKLLGTVINAMKNWFLLRSSQYPYYGYYSYYNSYHADPKKGSK